MGCAFLYPVQVVGVVVGKGAHTTCTCVYVTHTRTSRVNRDLLVIWWHLQSASPFSCCLPLQFLQQPNSKAPPCAEITPFTRRRCFLFCFFPTGRGRLSRGSDTPIGQRSSTTARRRGAPGVGQGRQKALLRGHEGAVRRVLPLRVVERTPGPYAAVAMLGCYCR